MTELAKTTDDQTPDAVAVVDATPAPDPGPAICDFDGCNEPATVSYVFGWGQSGVACAKHQFIRGQQAQNIGRTITFSPLANVPAAPLPRDQRVKMQAEILTLKEELKDSQLRGADLYQANVKLTEEVQRYHRLNEALRQTASDSAHEAEAARAAHDEMEHQLAESKAEVTRLSQMLEHIKVDPPADGA